MSTKKYTDEKGFRWAKKHAKKQNKKTFKRWQIDDSEFRCCHCKNMIGISAMMGTMHRNHCPYCLWSKHVDTKPGNRKSSCHGAMRPIGLTLKHGGYDKYGRKRIDDIMIIHICKSCRTVNINRIAADDSTHQIELLFEESHNVTADLMDTLQDHDIKLMTREDYDVLKTSLYGKYHFKG